MSNLINNDGLRYYVSIMKPKSKTQIEHELMEKLTSICGLNYYLSLIPEKSRMERYRGDELKHWEQLGLLPVETVDRIRESELHFMNDDEPYINNLITPTSGDITIDYLSTLSPDERDWLIRQLTSE